MNISQKLKYLMESANITSYRLSKELGVHASTIKNWIDGKDPKAEHLAKLANYFGTTVDRLISDETYETKADHEALKQYVNNDPELTEYLEDLRTRPEIKMMFQLTKDATKQDVEKAVKIVEAFLKDK